ncbi:C40 family peptidase [Streptomyces sp. NPDC002671]
MVTDSGDEVRQRIDSLYDQAETATGNYNATRAATAAGTRSRGIPPAKRSDRQPDPALDEVTRQWFDAARAKLGPTVPAVLPADRMLSGGGEERKEPGFARPELTAGRADARALAELTGRSAVPELPSSARPALPAPSGAPSAATRALPVAAPHSPAPAASKADNQRKIATARDLLSRHTAAPLPDPDPTPAATAAVLPAAAAPESAYARRAAKALAFARAQLGKPCVWGATGPDSYDCSSLTQGAWRAAGVTLPRAAYEQALAGTPVPLPLIEPGDLVLFFEDDRHVGLHIGDGMMIHAPGPGSYIREESIYGAGEGAIHRIVRPA